MIILVGVEKGGTGKSTVAVNLAAMRAANNKEVLLVDTDPQESATIWGATRSENGVYPRIACVFLKGKVGFELDKLRDKFDTIIVDAGGRDSVELRQSMAMCDKMIMPFRPSQFDTWSLDKMAALIRDVEEKIEQRINAYALLNAVSSNPSVKEADEMRSLLSEYSESFPTLQATLAERIAYRRAAREGLGAAELKKELFDAKAASELERLYKEVFNE